MIFLWLSLLAAAAFVGGRLTPANCAPPTASASAHYGGYAATATIAGGVLLLAMMWLMNAITAAPLPSSIAYAAPFLILAMAIWHARLLQKQNRRARTGFERLALIGLALAAALAALVTLGIVFTVAAESLQFFREVPPLEFFFGTLWSPQIAIREDQAGASGAFGFIPLLAGTLLITAIAMALATPTGLVLAVYLSEFSGAKGARAHQAAAGNFGRGADGGLRLFLRLRLLSPLLRDLGEGLGAEVAGESALAAGLVMGVMLIPFIASLSEDALFAAPESLRQGALALGATRFEAATQVMIPAALPGIVAGILLALSRAVGETMIVVMAAGVAANLTANPLEAVTTITVQIVTLLTGDQEFDDPKTLAAFALGLALFFITLALNLAALAVVRRWQQRYD